MIAGAYPKGRPQLEVSFRRHDRIKIGIRYRVRLLDAKPSAELHRVAKVKEFRFHLQVVFPTTSRGEHSHPS